MVDTTELNTTNRIIKYFEPLKFNVKRVTYKDNIVLQIEDIREKKKIETYDNKIKNITIVASEKTNWKDDMFDIIDTIPVIGLESFSNYSRFNPITVTVNNNNIISYLSQSNKYKYRLIPRGLLFDSRIVNDTPVIHVTCSGLSDAKTSILQGKEYQTLAQINLYEIENWDKIKKHNNWVYAQFSKTDRIEFGLKHLSYPFETAVLTDILNFDIALLDDSNKLIEFNSSVKIPSFSFDIQIIK